MDQQDLVAEVASFGGRIISLLPQAQHTLLLLVGAALPVVVAGSPSSVMFVGRMVVPPGLATATLSPVRAMTAKLVKGPQPGILAVQVVAAVQGMVAATVGQVLVLVAAGVGL